MNILALAMLSAWAFIAGPIWLYDDLYRYRKSKLPVPMRAGTIFRAGPLVWVVLIGLLFYWWGKRK